MKKFSWPYEFPGVYWLDEKEEKAVRSVLKRGSLFRYYGLHKPSFADKFEAAAKRFYDVKYALAINSGTGALSVAMNALGIGPGCEVIIPAYMWVATAGAVVQNNAIPVLCEIDDSFCMDPVDLERKITSRTKLIVPIHMSGNPCDMTAIMAIAKKHKIAVLEDSAQSNGGSFKGKKVGTFGDIGIFSLQLNKNMTSGEGGLLITNDEKLYYKSFSAHDMGLIRMGGRLATPEPYAIAWGQGRRMTELCGAVASVQITKLPQIVKTMLASKRRIKKMLEGAKGLSFRKVNDTEGDAGPFIIMILENERKAIDSVAKMKEAGLHNVYRIAEYGLHIYYNMPSLVGKVSLSPAGNPWSLAENAASNYEYKKGSCPQSDDLFARSILLPVPSVLTREQEKMAAEIIRNALV
jgi:dTDP-4-amino-4,6-dideoxygalactose transaminase